MENEYENIDRFDAYLKGVLAAEDKLVFEKELLENISFKNEFEMYKTLVEGIEESRKQELKDYIKTHKGKEISGGFKIHSRWYAAAAVIVFFVGVFILFQNKINPNQDDYYALENAENKDQSQNEILNENSGISTVPPQLKQGEESNSQNGNDLNIDPIPMEPNKVEKGNPANSMEIPAINKEKLLASNSFPVITYRDYLKDQKPVASNNGNKENSKIESTEDVSVKNLKTYSDDKSNIDPKQKPTSIETEIYDAANYKFHYLWTESNKIKLYGVDKKAKIVFLHTLNKYAVLINGNGYEIVMNKNIQPLKKTNLDIYLK